MVKKRGNMDESFFQASLIDCQVFILLKIKEMINKMIAIGYKYLIYLSEKGSSPQNPLCQELYPVDCSNRMIRDVFSVGRHSN